MAALGIIVVVGAGQLGAAQPAEAEHEVDRIEGTWTQRGGSTRQVITRIGPSSFIAEVYDHPSDCFPDGTPSGRLEGHEPAYAGASAHAIIDPRTFECRGYEQGSITIELKSAKDDDGREFLELHECTTRPSTGHQNCGVYRRLREDPDRDGLFDDEEQSGIQADSDPEIEVDLPAMGADPDFKDLFVEMDYMEPHQPSPGMHETLRETFLRAPVPNPSGTTGIALHLDTGPGSVMNPRTGETWGSLSESRPIQHLTTFTFEPGGRFNWSKVGDIRAENLDPARNGVFRYGLAVHHLTDSPTVTGVSRHGYTNFVVGMAGCGYETGAGDCGRADRATAGNALHELGHLMGLEHGGLDRINYKPNHFSVMNYNFADGIPTESGRFVVDYSRWDERDVPSLSETTGLDEPTGVRAAGLPTPFLTRVVCPEGAGRPDERGVVSRPFDFNCNDDKRETGLRGLDLNGDGEANFHRTFNEWDVVDLGAGGIAGGVPPDPVVPGDVETPEANPQSRQIQETMTGDRRAPRISVTTRGSGTRGERSARGARRVLIVVRDETELQSVAVRIGSAPPAEHLQVRPRRSGKVARRDLRVRPGTRVSVSALDVGGHVRRERARANR